MEERSHQGVTHRCCLTHSFVETHMRPTSYGGQEDPHVCPGVGGVPIMRVRRRQGPGLQGKLAIARGGAGDPARRGAVRRCGVAVALHWLN